MLKREVSMLEFFSPFNSHGHSCYQPSAACLSPLLRANSLNPFFFFRHPCFDSLQYICLRVWCIYMYIYMLETAKMKTRRRATPFTEGSRLREELTFWGAKKQGKYVQTVITEEWCASERDNYNSIQWEKMYKMHGINFSTSILIKQLINI